MDKELAALSRPRKHYITLQRDERCKQRHVARTARVCTIFFGRCITSRVRTGKETNRYPLASWSASELAKLPDYYIMDLHKGIAETMAAQMPSSQHIANCAWMTQDDLRVYSTEFARTGFQGGLNYYQGGKRPQAERRTESLLGSYHRCSRV